MNYLSFITATACIVLAVSGCQSPATTNAGKTVPDSTYTLIGKIQGLDSGRVYLTHRQGEERRTDSTLLKNGAFVFSGKAPIPEFCNLTIRPATGKEGAFGFFLQNGALDLSGQKDSLTDATVKITGAPAEDEFHQYLEKDKFFDSSFEKLGQAYEAAEARKDTRTTDSIKITAKQVGEQHLLAVKEYALKHPASYISAFEVYSNFSYNPDAAQLDSIYTGLDSSIRVSYFGTKIHETLEYAKKTAVGQPAPVFTLNDTHDKSVSLSSFKGKITLVDFWASWCGPCRGENPAVVRAYKKYHPKGFTILGVSLDEQKDKWVEAIKKDKLDWTQVSDLKGWKSSAAAMYGIKGIPMNYLLDKNGVIVAKGLRGEELEKKLAETIR